MVVRNGWSLFCELEVGHSGPHEYEGDSADRKLRARVAHLRARPVESWRPLEVSLVPVGVETSSAVDISSEDVLLRRRTARLRETARPRVEIVVRGAPEPSDVQVVPVEFPMLNRRAR